MKIVRGEEEGNRNKEKEEWWKRNYSCIHKNWEKRKILWWKKISEWVREREESHSSEEWKFCAEKFPSFIVLRLEHFFNFFFSALTFYEFIFPQLYVHHIHIYIFHLKMKMREKMRGWGGGWWWKRKWNEIPPSSPVMKNKKKSIARDSLIFLLFHFFSFSRAHIM